MKQQIHRVTAAGKGHRFFIVDVFAEAKYAGNQLAVVLPDSPIPDPEMQKIAREFNFPETTFVTSPRKRRGGYDVRIFTPNSEVPFAGHPTLGTAHVIAREIAGKHAGTVVLNLKVGPVPVRLGGKDGAAPLWMRQMAPVFGKIHDPKVFAKVLGLSARDFHTGFPVQEVSTGLPFLLAPLKSLAAVKKAATDMAAFRKYFGAREGLPLFLFSPETYSPSNQINCRMFAHLFGIPEDPATGSANGCLAGYLVKHRFFGSDAISVRVEQGYEIGRKSLLHLEAGTEGGSISVKVGGRVIDVAEGRLK